MMQSSTTYNENIENGNGNGIGNGNGHPNNNNISHRINPASMDRAERTNNCHSTDAAIMTTSNGGDYHPSQPQHLFVPSCGSFCRFCRWCCTFQHFCYVVQFVNCGLVAALIYLALIEYPKIQALEAQVQEDKEEIAALSEEVRQKQEGQIQSLQNSVEEQQQFNFLTLAGTFTLLTCLISMFHMTTHLQKFNQPKIQRKIIAILWMSPIYSVTSFLTLIVPAVEGWMAIIKDFYESYCIYVFLSFLIAVMGEGSRDKAVDVLAKHAGHLDRPTRCLGCFYEPPPDTSDHAKANAVMTQCQIYCLQFTLVRPLTTIFSVFVLHRRKKDPEDLENDNEDDKSIDDSYDSNKDDHDSKGDGDIDNNSNIVNSNQKNSTALKVDESSITSNPIGKEPLTASSYAQLGNDTIGNNSINDENSGDGGTRMLQDTQNKRRRLKRTQIRQDRWLQQQETGGAEDYTYSTLNPTIENRINDDDVISMTEFPSIVPFGGGGGVSQYPIFPGNNNLSPTAAMEEIPIDGSTSVPSFTSNDASISIPTFDPIAGVIPGSENNATSIFDHNNTGYDSIFEANGTTNFPPSLSPTMPPILPGGINSTNHDSSELNIQIKAYFRSPGFVVAMIVNISIFFAFSGLLKLYHAVREDLLWCRPFPKFLTIKAVVFLTFWQGLAILFWLVLTADPDEEEESKKEAHKYQNLLICVEMLLVAISQWCVFPANEWEPNYVPREMQSPGLGIKDFVLDVGEIVKNRSGQSRKERRAVRRRKRGGANSNKAGLYQVPGSASIETSQFDDFGGGTRADTFDDDDCGNSSSYDSSLTDDMNHFTIDHENGDANRKRILSDGTEGYNPDNEVSDDNLEML